MDKLAKSDAEPGSHHMYEIAGYAREICGSSSLVVPAKLQDLHHLDCEESQTSYIS